MLMTLSDLICFYIEYGLWLKISFREAGNVLNNYNLDFVKQRRTRQIIVWIVYYIILNVKWPTYL